MSEPKRRPHVTTDTRRAEGFSDGVFAIIITLLVLDLEPPDVPSGQLRSTLLKQWPTYLAYVSSYLYIAVVWLNHKHAFLRIREMSRGLHSANLGVLFTTALLPFATAVLSKAVQGESLADARTGVALYALVGVLLCMSWLVFFHYLSRHPSLLAEGVSATFFAQETTRALLGVALYAAAGLLGHFVTPTVALVLFLALPAFYGVTSHGLDELAVLLRRR